MTIKKLPVTLLTGFLGSGKTTILNRFIKERSSERILVIENEVGQVNIDGTLIDSAIDDIIELTAGCLCCSLADGLLDALEAVSRKQDQFDRLVIETTGVADPSSIVQVFLTYPMVGKYFDLEQVICVADAGLIEDWLEEKEEALRQIVMADVILINKADTVSPNYLLEVEKLVREINPHTVIYTGEQGSFPYQAIVDHKISDAKSFEDKLAALNVPKLANQRSELNEGTNNHKVNTFTLSFQKPFLLDEHLSIKLHRLVNLYRDQVYRIKGILHVEDYPNKVILQSVRTNCLLTDGSLWSSDEEKESKIVFIGKGLEKNAFENMFRRFL